MSSDLRRQIAASRKRKEKKRKEVSGEVASIFHAKSTQFNQMPSI